MMNQKQLTSDELTAISEFIDRSRIEVYKLVQGQMLLVSVSLSPEELEAERLNNLTGLDFRANDAQFYALTEAINLWGTRWKSKLKQCWHRSRYPKKLRPYLVRLQQIRERGGSCWLDELKLADFD